MKQLVIFGSGDFAKEVYFIAKKNGFNVFCFVSKDVEELKIEGIEVIKENDFFQENYNLDYFIAYSKDTEARNKILNNIKKNNYLGKPVNIIDPTASIEMGVNLGEGIFIGSNVSIGFAAKIEDFSLIHMNTSIGHDSIIGFNSILLPGCRIAGKNNLGENCFLGSGTVTFPSIKITGNTVVGAGSLIRSNITSSGKYFNIQKSAIAPIQEKIIIIAEAGVNHNGKLEFAIELANKAKDAGADYVKFQTYKTEKLVSIDAQLADYQKINSSENNAFEMLKKYELSFHDFEVIKKHCEKIGIGFLSTAFDLESLNFLNSLNIDFIKIPSGEITNYPLLTEINKLGKPVILSTGVSELNEIEDALKILNQIQDITILHCTSEYPAPIESLNLNAILHLKSKFQLQVGYSDHSKGILAAIAATAIGASIIEKHFTLDKNLDGPDHQASLEPSELKEMITQIKNLKLMLGDGIKKPSEAEIKNKLNIRKSIVASRFIAKNEIISESDLMTLRPGNGISPMEIPNIIGKKAIKDFHKGELIRF
jgi:N,N'-diacetyllegionaminate synthase